MMTVTCWRTKGDVITGLDLLVASNRDDDRQLLALALATTVNRIKLKWLKGSWEGNKEMLCHQQLSFTHLTKLFILYSGSNAPNFGCFSPFEEHQPAM